MRRRPHPAHDGDPFGQTQKFRELAQDNQRTDTAEITGDNRIGNVLDKTSASQRPINEFEHPCQKSHKHQNNDGVCGRDITRLYDLCCQGAHNGGGRGARCGNQPR